MISNTTFRGQFFGNNSMVMIRYMSATTRTPRARALAAALRESRTTSSIGLRELARRIGISHTLVSQWENGHRLPKIEDVATVLTGLGVDIRERERIIELARHAGDRDWLTSGIPGISQQLAGMIECERAASRMVVWSPLLIPGLLQTSDYARSVIGSGNLPRDQVESRVLFRSGRRDVLTNESPANLTALIGEPALGSRIVDREKLIQQLRYLRTVATSWRNVEVQVVPTSAPWHPGTAGPFVLYEFAESPPIVLLEHHRSSAFLYNDADLAEYRSAAEHIRTRAALNPATSRDLIADIIAGLERTS